MRQSAPLQILRTRLLCLLIRLNPPALLGRMDSGVMEVVLSEPFVLLMSLLTDTVDLT